MSSPRICVSKSSEEVSVSMSVCVWVCKGETKRQCHKL